MGAEDRENPGELPLTRPPNREDSITGRAGIVPRFGRRFGGGSAGYGVREIATLGAEHFRAIRKQRRTEQGSDISHAIMTLDLTEDEARALAREQSLFAVVVPRAT